MRQSQPMVECAFGWGRVFRLYHDCLDVNGTLYDLTSLVHVRSLYRRVIGIPSARLELCFKEKDVVLRGIAAVDDARKVVEYLTMQCTCNGSLYNRLSSADGSRPVDAKRDERPFDASLAVMYLDAIPSAAGNWEEG